MDRTLRALDFHYATARRYTRNISVIATSAMRRAKNAQLFIDRIVGQTQSNVVILSGEQEASCSFRGAVYSFAGEDGPIAVLDIGGGSTEYATGTRSAVERTVSCEVGAVRLTEWFPHLAGRDGFVDNETIDNCRERVRQLLSVLLEFPRASALITVGGTATTSASLVRGHPLPVHRWTLTRTALRGVFDRLCEVATEKRRYLPGMVRQRADILPAGMIVLDTALELLGHDACVVSRDDLLLGYLLSQNESTILSGSVS